ncbi:hypothetical protein SFRURICE_001260 [Spodoptera frugiperda]|nr:hypothetical protein SFRURICE_001260 [Spodoptera frugiperda]
MVEWRKILRGTKQNTLTDYYYTSVDLAEALLQRSTHLIGTVRKNRKGLPMNVIGEKLKKGEMVAMENYSGVLVFKWKDKRDVLGLSTRHKVGFVTVTSKRNKNKSALKPTAIADYNKHKSSIDLSDQLGSYSNPSRRNIRRFQKLAIELLLNTTVINAYLVYMTHKIINSKRYTITKFREQLCTQLLGLCQERSSSAEIREPREHKFGKNPVVDHRNQIVHLGTIDIDNHQLSIIFDPPHLLKGIRNNLLTKDMVFRGKIASWKDIITVYNMDCQLGHTRMNKKFTD